jgi:hypothetical protein
MIRVMADIQGFAVEPADLPNHWKIRKCGEASVLFEVQNEDTAVEFYTDRIAIVHNWSDFWAALNAVAKRLRDYHARMSGQYAGLALAASELL